MPKALLHDLVQLRLLLLRLPAVVAAAGWTILTSVSKDLFAALVLPCHRIRPWRSFRLRVLISGFSHLLEHLFALRAFFGRCRICR